MHHPVPHYVARKNGERLLVSPELGRRVDRTFQLAVQPRRAYVWTCALIAVAWLVLLGLWRIRHTDAATLYWIVGTLLAFSIGVLRAVREYIQFCRVALKSALEKGFAVWVAEDGDAVTAFPDDRL